MASPLKGRSCSCPQNPRKHENEVQPWSEMGCGSPQYFSEDEGLSGWPVMGIPRKWLCLRTPQNHSPPPNTHTHTRRNQGTWVLSRRSPILALPPVPSVLLSDFWVSPVRAEPILGSSFQNQKCQKCHILEYGFIYLMNFSSNFKLENLNSGHFLASRCPTETQPEELRTHATGSLEAQWRWQYARYN